MPTAAGTRSPASARSAPRTASMLASTLVIPARRENVQVARQFTALVLRVHAAEDEDGTAGLLVSELLTNSLLHSRSARPGGTVTVTVAVGPCEILVEVTDEGAGTVPAVPPDGYSDDAETGRGLLMVADLVTEWGYLGGEDQLTTWFTLGTGAPS